jgi:hypothetical protein
VARHSLDGSEFALIYVGPHPDGFVVLERDGQVAKESVFRKGDVYARHGSASERWQQEDVARLRARLLEGAQGIPELVTAPSLNHIAASPRLIPFSPVGALHQQQIVIYVKNVGNAIARIVRANLNTNLPASLKSPDAIAPRDTEPFEVNVQVSGEDGAPSGTEFMLRITYEGSGRTRELLTNVRYNRTGGFENCGSNIWEA